MPRRDYVNPVERITRPGRVSRPEFRLVLSPTSEDSDTDNAPLQGRTVSGTIYVFVEPQPDITRVTFYVDDALADDDNATPWELGTSTGGLLNGYDTTVLSNGTHTVRADIVASGNTYTVRASFTVANTGTYQNPIGLLKYAGYWGSTANRDKYRYHIVSLSEAAAAANYSTGSTGGGYVNASSCESNYWTGVDYPTALANDWLLRTSGGAFLSVWNYPSKYLQDVGSQSFRDEYVRQVLARTGYHELVFFDDTIGSLLDLTQNVYPAKYPNHTAWYNAMKGFVLDVCARLKANGRFVVCNAINRVNGINDASTTKTWWTDIAPGANGLMPENWLYIASTRRWDATNDYRAFWSGHQGLIAHAQSLGVGAFVLTASSATDTQTMRYMAASFLLDYNQAYPSTRFWASGNYDNSTDVYNLSWARDMGLPTAAKTSIGSGCYKRTFANGRVLVNPTLTPQTVDGVSLAATDAYLGA